MVKISNKDGALTIARKVRKSGKAAGIMARNNLNEAIKNSKNTIVLSAKNK